MTKAGNRLRIGSVFVLLIFCIFIFSVLLVLLLGARVLQVVSSSGDGAYAKRTCVQYITEKIRHSDSGGAVFVSGFSGDDADTQTLFLPQEIDGETYYTRIYYYNGGICELFSESGAEAVPADGTLIVECSYITFEQDSSLLGFTVGNSDGSESSMTVCLRSKGGEPS